MLIFDQFEELFTSYPDRWREREDFLDQVSQALDDDRLLRVVFAMREEYLANMDRFAQLFGEGLRTRFRLECMRGEAARRAIVEPLQGTGCSFDVAVADTLVQDLLENRVEDASGKSVRTTGEFVEPVQLQVVCQNLWRELPLQTKLINKEQLRKYGDVDEALKNFL